MRVFFLMNTFEAKSFILVTFFDNKSFIYDKRFIFVSYLRNVIYLAQFLQFDI